jgi:hypothetical protein
MASVAVVAKRQRFAAVIAEGVKMAGTTSGHILAANGKCGELSLKQFGIRIINRLGVVRVILQPDQEPTHREIALCLHAQNLPVSVGSKPKRSPSAASRTASLVLKLR